MYMGNNPTQATIDLGNEPPLVAYEDRNGPPTRREVSLRWLTGTVLTGLTSIVLIGGALMAALDGRYSVEAATQPSGNLQTTLSEAKAQKGDRITGSDAQFATRQIVQVNTLTREGDAVHIQAKPYALINATLETQRSNELSASIPPFNPLKLISGNDLLPDRSASDSIYAAHVEGEVTISVHDFPVNTVEVNTADAPSEADVERMVRDSGRFLADDKIEVASLPVVDPGRFDFDLAQNRGLSNLSVRIAAENVSFVSKTDDNPAYSDMDERIIPIREDTSLYDVLVKNDASDDEAATIAHRFVERFNIRELKPGQRVRIGKRPDYDSGDLRVERVSLYVDQVHQGTVALSDEGTYVAAAAPTTLMPDAFAAADRMMISGPTPSLYNSLYQTGLNNDLPEPLIEDLVHIFSYDVDYNARVKAGDQLEVFYSLDSPENGQPPEVLFTALTTGSERHRFYRFRTPDDGAVDFYDENGRSAKKFLMRKPVVGGRLSSPYGKRKHPILGYVRFHTGVDWALPYGTPIYATGDGVVEKAGWASGYGRFTLIRHANGYETGYGHQQAIAKGIEPGVHVKQGQIIGYVGSTGRSTGPHVHYEVRINDKFVDPNRVRLPRGRVLEGDMLASFERERERIDALLERGGGGQNNRVASR
ncbi:M23 family metallopeptidase [Breoghania sp.]|uniref:M23 family metallopeptidase n=1 Tax=Breoghania sp. TaxID=2065378 RepID=UPI002AAB3093|nr:M23 family metallopeptidase [Breoghania sp.]